MGESLATTQEVVMRSPASVVRMASLWLLLAACPALAQQTPRSIIERAIEAHGGEERLARRRADKVSLQGRVFASEKDAGVPFTADLMMQLPARFKYVAHMNPASKMPYTLVQIVDGDKVIATVDNQPIPPVPAALAELRAVRDLQRAARLLPLLSDPAYQLTTLGEEKVNNRTAIGVKVTMKGHKDLRLYFEHDTGLLIKAEFTRDDSSAKEVLQENFYGDFKDFGGIRWWTRLAVFRDGKKMMEAELVDVKYLDKIDESEFTKP
jgi:hypothetical protein